MAVPCADSTVSVVIPCYNQAQYLAAAVQSVWNQHHQPVECIVVDDGSTDGTAALASTLGVTLIRQANSGVSVSRNAGLAAAHGELVVFLDADDELLPEGLALEVEALASNRQAAAVVGQCEAMDDDGRPLPAFYHTIDPTNLYGEWLLRNFVWTPGAAMFKRRELLEAGGFPAALGPAGDYAVYLQLARTGRVTFLPQSIVRYRQHAASMSRDPGLMLRTTLAVLRREREQAPAWARAHIDRGRRSWRAWYGEQLVQRLRQDWRAQERGTAQMHAVLTLVSHCPGLVLQHLARKTRLTLSTGLRAGWRQVVEMSAMLRGVQR